MVELFTVGVFQDASSNAPAFRAVSLPQVHRDLEASCPIPEVAYSGAAHRYACSSPREPC